MRGLQPLVLSMMRPVSPAWRAASLTTLPDRRVHEIISDLRELISGRDVREDSVPGGDTGAGSCDSVCSYSPRCTTGRVAGRLRELSRLPPFPGLQEVLNNEVHPVSRATAVNLTDCRSTTTAAVCNNSRVFVAREWQ